MNGAFKVVCRGSWLSLAQAELFKNQLRSVAPEADIAIVIKETEGDRNTDQVLQNVEGKDFFTKDIQDFLNSGQADFAVHSLKDVSGEDFFGTNQFAIIERGDPRDVVLFNSDVTAKIAAGETVTVGTSSPRRTLMATRFLAEALPQIGAKPRLEAKPVRGNVDTRLRKLHERQYDGIILAAAGLNRLLKFGPSRHEVQSLLRGKKIMVLPFFDCPPAPGQGAIVAEANGKNAEAIRLLAQLSKKNVAAAVTAERTLARKYGSGCHQQFGVLHIDTAGLSFTFGAGLHNSHGQLVPFQECAWESPRDQFLHAVFSADVVEEHHVMKQKFLLNREVSAVFVDRLPQPGVDLGQVNRLWVGDTATWLALAKKGFWVEGCADGLGLNFIAPWLDTPLLDLPKSEVLVLAEATEERYWEEDGWNAISTAEISIRLLPGAAEKLRAADFVFWTNAAHYTVCKKLLGEKIQHGCLPGSTAWWLERQKVGHYLFPGMNAFHEWRTK